MSSKNNAYNLVGLKILLVSPVFYDYQNSMIEALTKLGARADFIEMNQSGFIYHLLKRGPGIRSASITKYITYKMEQWWQRRIEAQLNREHYQYLLVINGEYLHAELLNRIKNRHKELVLLKYQWDSVDRVITNFKETKLYYDHIFSFDPMDCKIHNLSYLPLFYINQDGSDVFFNDKPSREDIDILFVGQYHSDRYQVVKRIDDICRRKGIKLHVVMVIHPMRWLERKILDKEFRKSKISDFHYKAISKEDIEKVVGRSKVILDINAIGQTGLTMRTFETIGAKKKLLTTNAHVKNESFYNPEYIAIVDRENIEIDKEYIIHECRIPNIEEYRIDSWLVGIFQYRKSAI